MTVDTLLASVLIPTQDQLGEGPMWFADEGVVRWVDIVSQRVMTAQLDTNAWSVNSLDHIVSALWPRTGGGVVLAADKAILLIGADGRLEAECPIEADEPRTRLGDIGVDPAGRLWAGTLDRDLGFGRGSLYRIDEHLQVQRVITGVSISNGIGFSPDGSQMYYVDSPTQRIDVFDYDPSTGEATNRRAWVEIGYDVGVPDGLTVDTEGGVWVALWGGSQVRRYDAKARLDKVVATPATQPTSCTFVGPDLEKLVITTARVDLSETDLVVQPDAGALCIVDVGHRGLALPGYAG